MDERRFPLDRSTVSFDKVWALVFPAWKAQWLSLSVWALVFMMSSTVTQAFLAPLQGVIAWLVKGNDGNLIVRWIIGGVCLVLALVLALAVQGLFQLGFNRVLVGALMGEPLSPDMLLGQFRKTGRYLQLCLFIVAGSVLPSLLYFALVGALTLIVGGVALHPAEWRHLQLQGATVAVPVIGLVVYFPIAFYFFLPLHFSTFELAYTESSAWECIRNAYRMANGFRGSIFGYGLVGGLCVIAGFMACCVGVLPMMPLGNMLLAALYLSVKQETAS
jgi:hypothetical protein